MIDLSIIIPHYNSPDTLKKLIDTIPGVSEVEIIVVDDNSDNNIDEYRQCIKDCEAKRKNITFESVDLPAKGAGAARNKGLSLAKGKWVLFADADDFFVQEFWEIIQPCLQRTEDVLFFPPTSIIIGTEKMSDRHVHYSDLVKNYLDEPSAKNENVLRYQYWSPCSKMIRRELIEKNRLRFDEVLHSNDVMFSTRVGVYLNTFNVVDKVIYVITQSSGSLTSDKSQKSSKIRTRILCNYYFFLRKNLKKEVMIQLGYSRKDYWYFVLYKLGIIDIRDALISRKKK